MYADLISEKNLADQLWRLNNLYWMRDDDGKEFKFKLNSAQQDLYDRMWYLNVVLKARQIGFTSFIDLFGLDTCLFNKGYHFGIIADTLKNAKSIFNQKIIYPYDHLPGLLKERIPANKDASDEIIFGNDSRIVVSTSTRSGTFQMLHVSEYGEISVKRPDKANEIKIGSFESVHMGNMIFVESTAKGRAGDFYDLCDKAQQLEQAKTPLTELDFKFFFYPWWKDPKYVMDPSKVPIPQRLSQYFKELEFNHGIELSRAQKAWYVKKASRLGDDIKNQHPSTPEEAFEASIKGAIFKTQLIEAREQGRITKVPWRKGVLVDTWWDIGYSDDTAIWFTQDVGRSIHVIDYYEMSGEGAAFYAEVLKQRTKDRGYSYGIHKPPHDADQHEWGVAKTKFQSALAAGLEFDEPVPRVKDKWDSIEAARSIFPICIFDEELTEEGVIHLENYTKKWDEKHGVFLNKPLHNEHSNGADAFQTLGLGHEFKRTESRRGGPQNKPKGGWT